MYNRHINARRIIGTKCGMIVSLIVKLDGIQISSIELDKPNYTYLSLSEALSR